MKTKFNKNLIYQLIVFLIFSLGFIISKAQNPLSVKISESDLNDALETVTDARGFNFGTYIGGYGLNAWYINAENAAINITPGNNIYIDATFYACADIDAVLFSFTVSCDIDAQIEGMIEVIGDDTAGYTLFFNPIDLNIDVSGYSGVIEDLINALLEHPQEYLPDIELNIGSSILPDALSSYFKPSDPLFETTENELILNFDVLMDSLEIKNTIVQNGEIKPYGASYHITAGPNYTIANGGDNTVEAGNYIKLLPGFHARSGSEFKASIVTYDYPAFRFANPSIDNTSTESGTDTDAEDYITLPPLSEDELLIYPNPTQGTLTLDLPLSDEESTFIEITNLMGSLIYKKDGLRERLISIDISNQPNGIYFVKIRVGNKAYAHKIVKQ